MTSALPVQHVAVVVPAADEQDTIADCLTAIRHAIAQLHIARPDVTTDVVVVLDDCRDRTADIVATSECARTMISAGRCVGATRDIGTRTAVAASPADPARTWTAHTDADSVVPANWLTTHILAADQGADVLLGTVEPDLSEPHLASWRGLHGDSARQEHIHGANLGVRASVFAQIGGWPHVRAHEDVQLVRAARYGGHCVRALTQATVRTSARGIGRAPEGFATHLHGCGYSDG